MLDRRNFIVRLLAGVCAGLLARPGQAGARVADHRLAEGQAIFMRIRDCLLDLRCGYPETYWPVRVTLRPEHYQLLLAFVQHRHPEVYRAGNPTKPVMMCGVPVVARTGYWPDAVPICITCGKGEQHHCYYHFQFKY